MLRSRAFADPLDSVTEAGRRDRKIWWRWYAVSIAGTLLAAVIASENSEHQLFPIALVLLGVIIVVAIARPIAGVYLVVFCTVLGDNHTWTWYPFTKNLSSHESVRFVSNQLSV